MKDKPETDSVLSVSNVHYILEALDAYYDLLDRMPYNESIIVKAKSDIENASKKIWRIYLLQKTVEVKL